MSWLRNIWQRITGAFNRYEAATWTTSRSYIPASVQDARFDANSATRLEILRKSRYFEKNSAIAQRIGSVWCDYTVGSSGLILTPSSSNTDWNVLAKDYWNQTAQFIDLNSRQSFGVLQGMMSWRWLFDGEIFIVKTRGQSRDGRFFPRIQLVESHLVATPESMKSQEGKSIVDGVEIDANGRPTAYWMKSASDSEAYRRIEAENVIHVFEPSRPGEYRGISFFHAVINDLHTLDDLQILEMKAAADGAEKSTFIKSNTGQLNTAEYRRARVTGTTGSDTTDRTELYRTVIGGRTFALQVGEDVQQFIPNRPTEATRYLWDYLTSKVCIGIGVPKQLVVPYSIQGTVARADFDIANSFFKARSGIIAAAAREIYIYVLGWGIRTERGLADPPADWVKVTVRPPRSVNVDVGRNSSAMLSELKAGATNYEIIYSALGLDWRDEFMKLKEQQDFAAQIGLILPDSAATPQPMEEITT